jgi:CheY-like chemotaxis protein
LLEDAPVTVSAAENGEVAVRMVNEGKYDIVLMDMQMPVMDGLAATRVIRQNSNFNDLPIIAMTANVMAGDREKCLEAGMNDHLAKPLILTSYLGRSCAGYLRGPTRPMSRRLT